MKNSVGLFVCGRNLVTLLAKFPATCFGWRERFSLADRAPGTQRRPHDGVAAQPRGARACSSGSSSGKQRLQRGGRVQFDSGSSSKHAQQQARMSYTAFLKQAVFQLPPKYALFLGGWLYLCSHKNSPLPGTREIDLEEWVATPTDYLVHPSNHPKIFSRAPGESNVPDKRAELFASVGRTDPGATPVGHAHH